MGWAQAMRPYAGERWWPLLLLLAASAVLIWATCALLAHRDVGSGLLPPRPGPAAAGAELSSPLGLAVRLQRWTVVAWVAGLALTGVSYGTVVTDVGDLVGDNSALEDLIAQGTGDLTETFLSTALLTIALIGGGFAVSSTLRLRGEETAGHAEVVLATATARARWGASHLLVALAGSSLLLAAAGFGLGTTYGIVIGDAGEIPRLTGAALAYAPAQWVLVAITFALFGWRSGAALAAWAAFTAFVVLGFLGQLLGLPEWVLDLSPFHHVPALPAESFGALPLMLLTAAAVVLVVAGLAGLRRRDVVA
jgi:ABC-2 type transport system permease protein